MVLQPAVRTAADVATGTGGLLPHLFTLTWPVSPEETRGFGGRFLLRMHELTPVWQFHQCGALCCPDFPPLPVRPKAPEAAAEPPCFLLFFPLYGRSIVASRQGHLTGKRLRPRFAYAVDAAETVGSENQSEHFSHEVVEFRALLEAF